MRLFASSCSCPRWLWEAVRSCKGGAAPNTHQTRKNAQPLWSRLGGPVGRSPAEGSGTCRHRSPSAKAKQELKVPAHDWRLAWVLRIGRKPDGRARHSLVSEALSDLELTALVQPQHKASGILPRCQPLHRQHHTRGGAAAHHDLLDPVSQLNHTQASQPGGALEPAAVCGREG